MISAVQFFLIIILVVVVGGGATVSKLGAMIPVLWLPHWHRVLFDSYSGISSSGSAADLIANLSILLMAVVGGSLYPLSSLPDSCRNLSILTINRWSSRGLLNAFYEGRSIETLESIGALILLAFIYLTAASLILSFKRRRVAG